MTVRGDSLERGSVVGGYRIDELISRGGMGLVYRATNVALNRIYALKVIAPGLAEDEQFRNRFKREMRIAASLHHPNIVGIHYAGEQDGLLFFVMDYITGTDLREVLIKHGALDPDRAVELLEQLGSALDAAHRLGLVHRDVKPANVLITVRDGAEHAYLTDFGLAKKFDNASGLTAQGSVVGTVDYMAPEQITGSHTDARTDIYALGCVFYQMLSGRVPYERDNSVATLFAHVHEAPPPLAGETGETYPAFAAVLDKAMAKDPSQRYFSAGDFARDAAAALAGSRYTGPATIVGTGEATPVATTGRRDARPVATPDDETAFSATPDDTVAPAGATAMSDATSLSETPPPAVQPSAPVAPSQPSAEPAASHLSAEAAPAPTSEPPAPPAMSQPPAPPATSQPIPPAFTAAPSGGSEVIAPVARDGSGGTAAPPPSHTAPPPPSNTVPPSMATPPPPPQPPAAAAASSSAPRSKRPILPILLGLVLIVGIAIVVIVVTGGGGKSKPAGKPYNAALAPVPTNRVTGTGNGTVNLNGNQATVTVTTKGLLNGAPHAMHIHAGGRGECPPASAARGTTDIVSISTTDGIKFYGPPEVSLTSTGDTSAKSRVDFSRFPTTGDIDYTRTVTIPTGRRRCDSQWQCRDHRPRHRLQPQRRLRQRARPQRAEQQLDRRVNRSGALWSSCSVTDGVSDARRQRPDDDLRVRARSPHHGVGRRRQRVPAALPPARDQSRRRDGSARRRRRPGLSRTLGRAAPAQPDTMIDARIQGCSVQM